MRPANRGRRHTYLGDELLHAQEGGSVTELELSAQDPWTRTMLDLGPLAVVVPALACAELVIPAVSSSPAAAGDAASAAMRLLVHYGSHEPVLVEVQLLCAEVAVAVPSTPPVAVAVPSTPPMVWNRTATSMRAASISSIRPSCRSCSRAETIPANSVG